MAERLWYQLPTSTKDDIIAVFNNENEARDQHCNIECIIGDVKQINRLKIRHLERKMNYWHNSKSTFTEVVDEN